LVKINIFLISIHYSWSTLASGIALYSSSVYAAYYLSYAYLSNDFLATSSQSVLIIKML